MDYICLALADLTWWQWTHHGMQIWRVVIWMQPEKGRQVTGEAVRKEKAEGVWWTEGAGEEEQKEAVPTSLKSTLKSEVTLFEKWVTAGWMLISTIFQKWWGLAISTLIRTVFKVTSDGYRSSNLPKSSAWSSAKKKKEQKNIKIVKVPRRNAALMDRLVRFLTASAVDSSRFTPSWHLSFFFFNSSHVFSTIKRLLSSLMNYNRPLLRHVAAPLFHLADQKLLRRQQKPLSQVTGVVNNPVCDPGGFLWGCCLQLIRCEASCSGAVRAAGRAMSALVRRGGWGDGF